MQDLIKSREMEFLNGSLAVAMTKAMLTPVETMSLFSASFFFPFAS